MKIKKITIYAFLAVLAFSCNEIDKLLTFTISDQTTFKVNSTFPVNLPSEVLTPEVTTNSSAEFSNNKTSVDLVKDIKLKELKLTITDPANKTFSFLKSIHMYISTNADDEIELAYQDNINSTSNVISLITTTQKLDKYVKASSYKLRIKVTTKETLTQDITINSDMKFNVTANPL